MRPLCEIRKRSLKEFTEPLLSSSRNDSFEAGQRLKEEAKTFGLGLDDFCRLSIDLNDEEARNMLALRGDMDGFDMVLAKLNLPTHNNYKAQVVLQQSSDTFTTYPGTQVMFPYVVDSMLRWEQRQDQLENVSNLVASSRTINGVELVRVVGKDSKEDRQNFIVEEGGRIPVTTVRTAEQSVKMRKHGRGVQLTYEFERRSALDILTPFLTRVAREKELSKVKMCTEIMLNGDGVNPAATAYSQATLDGSATNGKISYDGIIGFAMQMAKKGTPIDTIAGNYDAYLQYLKMVGTPASSGNYADNMAEKGAPSLMTLHNIFLPIKFVLDTSVPAGKLLGFNKAETIEELIEANSRIIEQDNTKSNQINTYYNTEVAGFSLIYGDTRGVYTYDTTTA